MNGNLTVELLAIERPAPTACHGITLNELYESHVIFGASHEGCRYDLSHMNVMGITMMAKVGGGKAESRLRPLEESHLSKAASVAVALFLYIIIMHSLPPFLATVTAYRPQGFLAAQDLSSFGTFGIHSA